MEKYDVVVLGLGAMGSAATYQLASNGAEVLGIDQFSVPHSLGSSHGETRITRQAVGEGPEYAPFVMRSHELWRDIERKVGYELLNQCGGLVMGIPRQPETSAVNAFVDLTTHIAEQNGIPHETLDGAEIKSRFPLLNTTGKEHGYYEPGAGYLRPENCTKAQLDLAVRNGAKLHTNERVAGFEDDGDGVTVITDKASYRADKLVVAAGPWVGEMVPDYNSKFTLKKNYYQ